MKRALPFILCFVAGSLSALAMAPYNAWYILFVTLGIFYACLARANAGKQAFGLSWLFGFGYFLFGLSWIGNALLVEGNPYKWAYPLAVAGLPFALAFFYGFAGWLTRRFFDLKTVGGYFAFAAVFALTDWVRGHIFTGFPWNLFGYSWVDILPVVQITALGSVYLLTWLTILWASVGGFVFLQPRGALQKAALPGALIAIFAAVFAYGQMRINSYVQPASRDIQVKLVQPNIAQHEKWNPAKMPENFFKQLRLSYPEGYSEKVTYIVWPETALSYVYTKDETSMNLIKQMLASYESGAYLFTGLLRLTEDGAYANSFVMIDKDGQITNIYDKHHLVPFGEYIPLQKFIPLAPIVEFSGFIKGNGTQSYTTPEGIRYSPLVCYEAIFPEQVAKSGDERPDFLLNATNDAWYGQSAGPYQHLTQTRFRAVEEGLPLIRVANTGISAVISPTGAVIKKTTLFEEVFQTEPLPAKRAGNPPNSLIKNIFFFAILCASLAYTLFARVRINTKD
ncbi:MAG: apolipoprotein N-acyltransferase [Alphaproteobacteria bacterium]|nr:apolipoprotein N-acyltransferase [Alphaproteobacteria bacterium]